MQKSTVKLVAELSRLLLAFPALVNSFERKQPQVLLQLTTWLREAEDLLSAFGHVSAAELAGQRSKLLQPVYQDDRRGSLRKHQLALAVAMLFDLQATLQQALMPYQQKLQQSRELIRHLLSVIRQSGALNYADAASFELFVQQLWQLIGQHEQLKASAVQLRSWLSEQDVVLLLAEEVNPTDFA